MSPLPRVLEPELMDTPEEAVGYDTMDHSAVNCVFVEDFLAGYRGGPVLDVGTGTAQIPIELCRRHPSVTVEALDAAGHMLAVARQNVERADLAGRITLRLAPAQRLPYA